MSRRVQYTEIGGPEVLHIVEVEPPHPGPGEVRVQVRAAGLNPLDAKIFQGRPTASPHKIEFPMGNGADFAGVIDELGADVTAFGLADEVFGGLIYHAQADFVVVSPDRLFLKPPSLTMEQAAALDTVGRTAAASVASLSLGPEDIVLVSAAAGGVGVLAGQLAKRTGAVVIGTASEANHEFLHSLGVHPVEYGAGLVQAVRAISPNGVTAALDNHGRETVEAALELGAPPNRVNTIADYGAPADFGATMVGSRFASSQDIRELAALIAAGEIVLPIDSVFPLERVGDAYERLIAGHVRGKIVLEL